MARQRTFSVCIAIAVFILLLIFYNPAQSTIEPDLESRPKSDHSFKFIETVKPPPGEDAAQAAPAFVADWKPIDHSPPNPTIDRAAFEAGAAIPAFELTTTTTAIETSEVDIRTDWLEPTIKPTAIVPFEGEVHLNTATTSATQAASGIAGGLDDLDRVVSGDPFAYLTTTTGSIDPFAYLNTATTSERSGGTSYFQTARALKPDPTNSGAAHESNPTTVPKIGSDGSEKEAELWQGNEWFFQEPLKEYENPKFDVEKMKSYAPHNWQGPGHEAYATFLSTQNSSLHDPYFLAVQQQVYRFLWHPSIHTVGRPFVVFVAPHISQTQRDYLLAAGAMVRELDIITYHPTKATSAPSRWKDMFSKLNFWAQLEFSRLLYVDTDCFPLVSMDPLFDIGEEQQCNRDLLNDEDRAMLPGICSYTFLAAMEKEGEWNAGMMLISPNKAMHSRLLRESLHEDNFLVDGMEQALLRYTFGSDSPFPAQTVGREWNAVKTTNDDEGKINVVHEKMWNWALVDHFTKNYFRDTWDEMLKLYETQEFVGMRAQDGSADPAALEST